MGHGSVQICLLACLLPDSYSQIEFIRALLTNAPVRIGRGASFGIHGVSGTTSEALHVAATEAAALAASSSETGFERVYPSLSPFVRSRPGAPSEMEADASEACNVVTQ